MKKIILTLGVLSLAACGGITQSSKIDTENGDKVFFAFDSGVISEESKENLLGQSLYLKNNPDKKVVIEGNCDERGSSEYNLALGSMRSSNAAQVLLKDGIEKERIKTISYGKEKPQVLGTGEEVWAKNRNATTRLQK